jgi:putative flavoprotein involved in K+ transport
MTPATRQVETLIIGGGQAGLAVAYHLKQRRRPVTVVDASERVGDSWRKRWDSLRVFTPARYDGLPGWRFPARSWSYPTKNEMANYLEAYAARFELDVATGVSVTAVARTQGGFVVLNDQHRYLAAHVVIACGGYQVPRIPSFAADLDSGITQLHSSQYRNPAQLPDGGVLVVGAGNSGAEIAVEAADEHRTWLSGRDVGQEPVRAGGLPDRVFTPPFWFALTRVLSVRTPLGRKARDNLAGKGLPLARVRRRDIAAAGVERVPRVTGIDHGLPVLEDGRTLRPSTVMWCTGFRSDFSWIDLPIFDSDGKPRHDRGVVAAEPGLYFVGLFFQSTAASSLIGGVGRDAARIAAHIAAHRAEVAHQQAASPIRT